MVIVIAHWKVSALSDKFVVPTYVKFVAVFRRVSFSDEQELIFKEKSLWVNFHVLVGDRGELSPQSVI